MVDQMGYAPSSTKAVVSRFSGGRSVKLSRFLLAALIGPAMMLPASTAEARPGDLDPSFARGGQAVIPFGHRFSIAEDVVAQADGRILVIGNAAFDRAKPDFAMARYLADGRLDPTFGSQGVVAGDGVAFGTPNTVTEASSAILLGDGSFLVGGTSIPDPRLPRSFLLARFLADGSSDPSFSDDGIQLAMPAGLSAELTDIALQLDGRIVAVGTTSDQRLAVMRFLPEGQIDTSFGVGGSVVAPSGFRTSAEVALPGPHGSVLIGGALGRGYNDLDASLVRLLADGTPDPSFGEGGIATTDFGLNSRVSSLAYAPDGSIVSGVAGGAYRTGQFGLTRHLADGAPDPTLGGGDGKVSTVLEGISPEGLTDLEIQPNGRILVVGDSDAKQIVLRYLPNGLLDNDFSGDGVFRLPLATSSGYDSSAGMAASLLPGGDRLVVVGYSSAQYVVMKPEQAVISQHLLDDGPGDADADRTPDKRDLCDLAWSRRPAGCPIYSRALRIIGPEPGSNAVTVTIQSKNERCESTPVNLYRQRPGPDLALGEGYLHPSSASRDTLRFGSPGHVYARVPRLHSDALGICKAARTEVIRVPAP